MLKAFIIALIVMFGLLAMIHVAMPVFAGVIAVGTGIWAFLITSVVAFCVFIMAIFLVPIAVFYIIGVVAVAWLVLAIFALPLAFPILLPLFIVMLFVMYNRRQRKKSNQGPKEES